MNLNQPWLQRLKSKECPDATYESPTYPLVLQRAEGSTVWDVNQTAYTDLCCGFGSLALGHRHSSLLKVFAESQLIQGMGDVFANQYKVDMIETLMALMPNQFSRAALAISGGQAVELAMKTAMLATGHFGFITLKGGYHGLDLGVLPLTSREDFKAPFNPWFRDDIVQQVHRDCDLEQLISAIDALRASGVELAGIVVEPVMGRHGIRKIPVPQLQMFANVAHEYGGLLIFDEVMTGMGRTGTYCHAQDVEVDLLCFGKILGGGLPVSACVGTEKTMGAWPNSTGEAIHTGTYFGHALSCHASIATMHQIQENKLVERSAKLGAELKHFLRSELASSGIVKEVRGEGMLFGVEFEKEQTGLLLMESLLRRGVIVLPAGERGQCISMTPALNIPHDQLFSAMELIVEEVRGL